MKKILSLIGLLVIIVSCKTKQIDESSIMDDPYYLSCMKNIVEKAYFSNEEYSKERWVEFHKYCVKVTIQKREGGLK